MFCLSRWRVFVWCSLTFGLLVTCLVYFLGLGVLGLLCWVVVFVVCLVRFVLVGLFTVFVIVVDCWLGFVSWLLSFVNSVDLHISFVLFIWLVFVLLCLCLIY